MGRQNERTGPLGCGHSRGLFLVAAPSACAWVYSCQSSQKVPSVCNGKCNGKSFSSLGVRPMAFPQVSLEPICRVTLSVSSRFKGLLSTREQAFGKNSGIVIWPGSSSQWMES